ncbi:uncharacterized protein LOC112555427 [Pomacea canaliculata]|uniref:uncharacterized protein LOC112555427 n=1 Tax=Pomacea canaliculata TaxID=400727 RepID=UPI000D72D38E|nr:uncharacterized protein LOC112555427 [Pomacea canaliculata]XP_025079609.1 uncharacterized protein LOC112555427 [Pomacea canaliculata]XP_025079610.1 uncharacterized protein LOC112555427 [Pomacea canaliculata]
MSTRLKLLQPDRLPLHPQQGSSASSSSSPSLPLSTVCQEIETGGGGKKSRLPERFSADHDGDLCYQVHRRLNPPRTPSTNGRSKLCKVSSLAKKEEFPTAGQRDKSAVSSEGITSQISTGSPGNLSFLSLPFPSSISTKSEASPHRNTSRHPSSSRSSYLTQDTRARWRLTSNIKKGSPSLVSRSISRENARRSSPLLPESSGPRPKINQGIAGIKKDTDLENHLLNLSCTKPAEHKASSAEHQFCSDGVVGKKARESSVCQSIKTGAELCETEISSSRGATVNVQTLTDFVSVELNLKEEENSKDFSARGEKVIELEGNDKNILKKYVKCGLSDCSLIAVEKGLVRHGGQKVTDSKRSCRIDRSVQELKAIVSPRVAAVTVKPALNTTTSPSVKTYRQIARHRPKQVKTVETENAIGQPLKSDVSQLPTSWRHAPSQHRLAEAETSIITGVDIRGPSAEDDHSSKSEKRATHRSESDAPGVDGHNSCLRYESRHEIPHTKGIPRSKAYKPSKRNEYRENTELDLSPSASSRAKILLRSPVAGSCLGHSDLLNEGAVTCNAAADHQRGGSGRRWVMSAEGKGSPSSQNKRQLLRRSSPGKTDKDGNGNEFFSRQSAANGTHDAARQKDRSFVPRVRKVNRTNQITPAGSSSYCLSQSRGAARTSNTSVTKVKVIDKTSQQVKENESRAAPLTAIALTAKCHQQSQTPEARASASSLETWSRLKCYNRGENNLVSISTEDNITHAQHLSETSHEQEVSDSSAGDPAITHRCVDGDAQSVSVSISMTKPSDVGQVYNLLSQKPKIIAASCIDTSTDHIKLNSGFETTEFVRRKTQQKLNAEARNDLQTTLAPELSVDRCSLSLSSELTQAKETDKVSAVLQSNNTDHIDTNRTYINTRGATVLSSFEGGSAGLQTHTCYSPAESFSRERNLSATNGRSAGVRTVYSHSACCCRCWPFTAT